MSISDQQEAMQIALNEAKTIINEMFVLAKAPEKYLIKHMTLDELIVALYRLFGLWNNDSLESATVSEDKMLQGTIAYNERLEKIIGNIESLLRKNYTPGSEDIIIPAGKYIKEDQVILGSQNLIPENIKEGIKIFGVTGTLATSIINYGNTATQQLEENTAKSKDILEDKFAYRSNLTKMTGSLRNNMDQTINGRITNTGDEEDKNLYISVSKIIEDENSYPFSYKDGAEKPEKVDDSRSAVNENTDIKVSYKQLTDLIDLDPSKIEAGYNVLGIEGEKHTKEINKDTNGDGEPDINIPVGKDQAYWIDWNKVLPENKNKPIYLNDDTNFDDEPDINIDTNGDGKPDINIDTDNNGMPDLNVITNNTKYPYINFDTNGDGKPDENIYGKNGIILNQGEDGHVNKDTDGDGYPNLNIDTDGDGIPDTNIDTDGDGIPDLNIDSDGDGKADLNIDTDGDLKPDINLDTDFDGIADKNLDPEPIIPYDEQPYSSLIDEEKEGAVPGTIPNFVMDKFDNDKLQILDNNWPDPFEAYRNVQDIKTQGRTRYFTSIIQAFPNSRSPLDFYCTYTIGLNEKDEQSIEQRVLDKMPSGSVQASKENAQSAYYNAYFGMHMIKRDDIVTISYSGPKQSIEDAYNEDNVIYQYQVNLKDPRFKKEFEDYELWEERDFWDSSQIHRGLRYGIFTDGLVSSKWKIGDNRVLPEEYTVDYNEVNIGIKLSDDQYAIYEANESRFKEIHTKRRSGEYDEDQPDTKIGRGKNFGNILICERNVNDAECSAGALSLYQMNLYHKHGEKYDHAKAQKFRDERKRDFWPAVLKDYVRSLADIGITRFWIVFSNRCEIHKLKFNVTDRTWQSQHEFTFGTPDKWRTGVTEATSWLESELNRYFDDSYFREDDEWKQNSETFGAPVSVKNETILFNRGILPANMRKEMYDVLTWNDGIDHLYKNKLNGTDFAKVLESTVWEASPNDNIRQGSNSYDPPLLHRGQFYVSKTIPLNKDFEFHAVMHEASVDTDRYYGTGGLVILPWDYKYNHYKIEDEIEESERNTPIENTKQKSPIYNEPENNKEHKVPGTLRIFDEYLEEIRPFKNQTGPKDYYIELYPNSIDKLGIWCGWSSQEDPFMWEERTLNYDAFNYLPQPDMSKYSWMFNITKTGSIISLKASNPMGTDTPYETQIDLSDEQWIEKFEYEPDTLDETQISEYFEIENRDYLNNLEINTQTTIPYTKVLTFISLEDFNGTIDITSNLDMNGYKIIDVTYNEPSNELVKGNIAHGYLKGWHDHLAWNDYSKFLPHGKVNWKYDLGDIDLSISNKLVQEFDNNKNNFSINYDFKNTHIYEIYCKTPFDVSKNQTYNITTNFEVGTGNFIKRRDTKAIGLGICVDGVKSSKWTWKFNEKDSIDIEQEVGPRQLNFLVKTVPFNYDCEYNIKLSDQIDNEELYFGNAGLIVVPSSLIKPDEEEDKTKEIPGTLKYNQKFEPNKEYIADKKEEFDNMYMEFFPNTTDPTKFIYTYSSQEDDRALEGLSDINNIQNSYERTNCYELSYDYNDSENKFTNLYFGIRMEKNGNSINVYYSQPQKQEDNQDVSDVFTKCILGLKQAYKIHINTEDNSEEKPSKVTPYMIINKTQYEINKDTNSNGFYDVNIDTDGDGVADINIDIDNDGLPEINIDIDGDKKPELNIIDENGRLYLNIDTNCDLIPELNIDKDLDGIADYKVDTNNDGIADTDTEEDYIELDQVQFPPKNCKELQFGVHADGLTKSKWIWPHLFEYLKIEEDNEEDEERGGCILLTSGSVNMSNIVFDDAEHSSNIHEVLFCNICYGTDYTNNKNHIKKILKKFKDKGEKYIYVRWSYNQCGEYHANSKKNGWVTYSIPGNKDEGNFTDWAKFSIDEEKKIINKVQKVAEELILYKESGGKKYPKRYKDYLKPKEESSESSSEPSYELETVLGRPFNEYTLSDKNKIEHSKSKRERDKIIWNDPEKDLAKDFCNWEESLTFITQKLNHPNNTLTQTKLNEFNYDITEKVPLEKNWSITGVLTDVTLDDLLYYGVAGMNIKYFSEEEPNNENPENPEEQEEKPEDPNKKQDDNKEGKNESEQKGPQIQETPINEENNDPAENPSMENPEPNDDDHKSSIVWPYPFTVGQEEVNIWMPNPALQWLYTDYYLPKTLPTMNIYDEKKYSSNSKGYIKETQQVQAIGSTEDIVYVFSTSRVPQGYWSELRTEGKRIELWQKMPSIGKIKYTVYSGSTNKPIRELNNAEDVANFLNEYKILDIKNEEDQNMVKFSNLCLPVPSEQEVKAHNANHNIEQKFITGGKGSGNSWNWSDNSTAEYINFYETEMPNVNSVIVVEPTKSFKWTYKNAGMEDSSYSNAALFERIGCRKTKTITKMVENGNVENIQSNEMKAALIPFMDVAIAQEQRKKMYHYGSQDYLNLPRLFDHIDAEIDNIVEASDSIIANSNVKGNYTIDPLKDYLNDYKETWPTNNTENVNQDVYQIDENGNITEIPDYVAFNHNDYLESAKELYMRLGKTFEHNGYVNSYVYTNEKGEEDRRSPTVTIDGEPYLQVILDDLKLEKDQCDKIWTAAFQDFNDYIPVWYSPLYEEAIIDDVIYESEYEEEEVTISKNLSDIVINNNEWSPRKDTLEFTPNEDFNGTFYMTMNTGHWYFFKIYNKEEYDANPTEQYTEDSPEYKADGIGWTEDNYLYADGINHGKKVSHVNGIPQTFYCDVQLKAGVTYLVRTAECPGGGKSANLFQYSFKTKDSSGNDADVKVQYKAKRQIRKQVEKPIERTIVSRMFLKYYENQYRDKWMLEIEDTFNELKKYVSEYVRSDSGTWSQEIGGSIGNLPNSSGNFFVGNIFERSAVTSEQEKMRIAKCIHDYLVVFNEYDYSELCQTLYPALSRGKQTSVCASYAHAFKYCCNRFGIVSHIVVGSCYPEKENRDNAHMWNRICYASPTKDIETATSHTPDGNTRSYKTFKEPQYLHNDIIIKASRNNDTDKNMQSYSITNIINSLADRYDKENKDNYLYNNKAYFEDPNNKNNDKRVSFIQSHYQFDKDNWTEVDVTWDDTSGAGSNSFGKTDKVSWKYLNISSSDLMKEENGHRLYTKLYATDFMGLEIYANLPGQDSHEDQDASHKSIKYTNRRMFDW